MEHQIGKARPSPLDNEIIRKLKEGAWPPKYTKWKSSCDIIRKAANVDFESLWFQRSDDYAPH